MIRHGELNHCIFMHSVFMQSVFVQSVFVHSAETTASDFKQTLRSAWGTIGLCKSATERAIIQFLHGAT